MNAALSGYLIKLTCSVSSVQTAKPAEIIAKFGRGKAGSLLVLARLLVSRTPMWIYGGFIRDLMRGDVHPVMDLDVGLPPTGLDASAGMSSIVDLAAAVGIKYLRKDLQDRRVCRGFSNALDSSVEFEVQVCFVHCTAKFLFHQQLELSFANIQSWLSTLSAQPCCLSPCYSITDAFAAKLPESVTT